MFSDCSILKCCRDLTLITAMTMPPVVLWRYDLNHGTNSLGHRDPVVFMTKKTIFNFYSLFIVDVDSLNFLSHPTILPTVSFSRMLFPFKSCQTIEYSLKCNNQSNTSRQSIYLQCDQLDSQIIKTSRERHKSAPYLRLKNSKRTSKCQVFSSTVHA